MQNRVRGAFPKIESGTEGVKTLRIDALLPFGESSIRLRYCFEAPGRHGLVIMSGDGKCPIAVSRDGATLIYDVARGRMRFARNVGAPFLRFFQNEDGGVTLASGFTLRLADDAKDAHDSNVQINFASLLQEKPVAASLQARGDQQVYEETTERGGRLVAWLSAGESPRLIRFEIWGKGDDMPLLLFDRIEINRPLPAGSHPNPDAGRWKGALPVEEMIPAAWKELSDREVEKRWAGLWVSSILAYDAIERGAARAAVLPRAGAAEWERVREAHAARTPAVLERWKQLYGAAVPPPANRGVLTVAIDADGPPTAVEPTEEETELARELFAKLRDRTSAQDDLPRLAVEGTACVAGEPAYRYRAIVDGDQFGFHAVTAGGSIPLAIADENALFVFDATQGRIAGLNHCRSCALLYADADSLGPLLSPDSPKAPRISLPFRRVMARFPENRRGLPHPQRKGWFVLEGRNPAIGALRYFIDPRANPTVREVRLTRSERRGPRVLLRVHSGPDDDAPPERKRVTPGPFKGLLPGAPLRSDDERWKVRVDGEIRELDVLRTIVLERMALGSPDRRDIFPSLSKQHWIAFEQRERELTPKVVAAWRKAFGTLR